MAEGCPRTAAWQLAHETQRPVREFMRRARICCSGAIVLNLIVTLALEPLCFVMKEHAFAQIMHKSFASAQRSGLLGLQDGLAGVAGLNDAE